MTDHKLQQRLEYLLEEVRACRACAGQLPFGPRPVLRADARARLLVVGQAPGTRVHETGIPWNDPSGDQLRAWMGVDRDFFYDAGRVAIIPMGFCYPGKGSGGDLPPRPECAALWRERLLALLPAIGLTLVIGRYALDWHLPGMRGSVAERVARWRECLPDLLPMPHPSPRNRLWLKRHAWFEAEVVPALRRRLAELFPQQRFPDWPKG
ncbi:MAG TPA: uracil-DNA glycosylase family protein [Gammaproteobacteria bacterium]|nr:uracil-DNA glycosylase family protein [Gammaproteobacteria bacterium]